MFSRPLVHYGVSASSRLPSLVSPTLLHDRTWHWLLAWSCLTGRHFQVWCACSFFSGLASWTLVVFSLCCLRAALCIMEVLQLVPTFLRPRNFSWGRLQATVGLQRVFPAASRHQTLTQPSFTFSFSGKVSLALRLKLLSDSSLPIIHGILTVRTIILFILFCKPFHSILHAEGTFPSAFKISKMYLFNPRGKLPTFYQFPLI